MKPGEFKPNILCRDTHTCSI